VEGGGEGGGKVVRGTSCAGLGGGGEGVGGGGSLPLGRKMGSDRFKGKSRIP